MAVVRPFCGLRYNREKITDFEKVVTPPYDIISLERQRHFHEKSPFNSIRLDFGMIYATDDEQDNRYKRSARDFLDWQKQDILKKDTKPAFYLYHVTFPMGAEVKTRKGFMGLVRLEDFAAGVVKPHEKTFPKVTSDRLKLLEHCKANFSPIFSLYNDPRGRIIELLESSAEKEPLASFSDWDGLKHEMWAVTAPGVISQIKALLSQKTLLIADGHHRYTTGLQYRDKMKGLPGTGAEDPDYNYIMMYLCAMEDKGMLILPTHRILNESDYSREDILERACDCFDIVQVPLNASGLSNRAKNIQNYLESKSGNPEPTIGFYEGSRKDLYLLSPKKGIMEHIFGTSIPKSLLDLDVVVLSELLLGKIMGLKDKNWADITYSHDLCEILARAEADNRNRVFILNPTRMEQVKTITDAGMVMPHKSTYFYPKVLTGLVINKLEL